MTSLTHTEAGLTAGTTYQFTVESRNSFGYSIVSDELTLLCAFIPEPPASITTSNLNDQVVVAWVEPVTNGSPITAYKVFIQQNDLTTFTEESVECIGTDAGVISSR